MMLGGGCGRELAHWIIHGRPEKDMYGYDIRYVGAQVSERRQVTQEGVVLSLQLPFSSKGSRNWNNDEASMRSE